VTGKVNKIIPMAPAAWEATKLIASANERSASAQVRHWINEGIRMVAEQDRLDEIEANAKVIELHEDRSA
jgi:hypothetical protein